MLVLLPSGARAASVLVRVASVLVRAAHSGLRTAKCVSAFSERVFAMFPGF